MTTEERRKVATVARVLGELLDRGAISIEQFNADMTKLTEVAMLLTLIHRQEEHTAEIIAFHPRGEA